MGHLDGEAFRRIVEDPGLERIGLAVRRSRGVVPHLKIGNATGLEVDLPPDAVLFIPAAWQQQEYILQS